MERGLTKEQIEAYQFCSTPAYGTENLARKLIKEGYSLLVFQDSFLMTGGTGIAFYRGEPGDFVPGL